MTSERTIGTAKVGLLANIVLALVKFLAGILGHSHALIADGIESATDVVSSLFVLGGLRISSAPPDDDHPFGHGKAEAIASAVISLLLMGIAMYTAFFAVSEALVPHAPPAIFTLLILAIVIFIKEFLFRTVSVVSKETGSNIVKTDAWHHRSDAISSAAAFIGISIAIVGGHSWASADSWAALIAAIVILTNATLLLLPALDELMDKNPGEDVLHSFRKAALSVEEVRAVEKLRVLRRGARFYVDIHIEMDGNLSLEEAHRVTGKVKSAFRKDVPFYADSSIHMEPFLKTT